MTTSPLEGDVTTSVGGVPTVYHIGRAGRAHLVRHGHRHHMGVHREVAVGEGDPATGVGRALPSAPSLSDSHVTVSQSAGHVDVIDLCRRR